MHTTVESSWKTIRSQLVAARLRAGLDRSNIVRRLNIHRSTVRRLENDDQTGIRSRMDTALGYAHTVGLELAVVPPQLAHLLALDHSDTVAILRAAQAAAEGHRLNPLQTRKINEILAKVLPTGQQDT